MRSITEDKRLEKKTFLKKDKEGQKKKENKELKVLVNHVPSVLSHGT